jgi:hypothetical protein
LHVRGTPMHAAKGHMGGSRSSGIRHATAVSSAMLSPGSNTVTEPPGLDGSTASGHCIDVFLHVLSCSHHLNCLYVWSRCCLCCQAASIMLSCS